MEGPEFPGNSHRDQSRSGKLPEKKVEKVIQGEVLRRKKPLSKRFKEMFVGNEARSAWSFVALEVLVPAAKDALADAVSQGAERMIFGEARSRSRRTGRHPTFGTTNYTRFSSSRREDPRDRERPNMTSRARANFDFDEIILPYRPEAEEVIDQLFEIIAKYETATVADLYSLVGINANYTDDKYGWSDIRGANVTRVTNGYLLDLPRPEPLD